jgi:hypothetical protein
MVRQWIVIATLLLGSLTATNGKEAEAANEDVPRGPTAAPPPKPSTDPSQNGSKEPPASVGSVGDKKSAPSSGGPAGGGKPAASK